MKCTYCKEPASRGVIWADGRGRIPVCEKHLDKAVDIIENRNNDAVDEIQTIESRALAVVTLIEAGKSKKSKQKKKAVRNQQRKDSQKLEPDKYRKKWGRCPHGYHVEDEKCVKTEEITGPAEKRQERKKDAKQKGKKLVESPPTKGDEPRDIKKPKVKAPTKIKKPPKPATPTPSGPKPKELTPEQTEKQQQTKERLKEKREKGLAPPSVDTRERAKERRLGRQETKRKQAQTPEQRRSDALNNMAKKDPAKYRETVDKLRQEGVLPDPKTARMMISVENPDDVPEEIKKDPKKLKQFVRQHVEQRQHEERIRDARIKHLEQNINNRVKMMEDGKVPKDVPWLKFLSNTEKQFGRPIPHKEEAVKQLQKGWDKLKATNKRSAPEPNRWAYKLKKWAATLIRPIQKFRRSGSTAMTIARFQMVLDEVSEGLEARKATKLAAYVDVVTARIVADNQRRQTVALLDAASEYLDATGNGALAAKIDKVAFPLADELPTPTKVKPGDLDFELQTGDYGENLRFPPYDKARPKTKGDEGED